MTYTLFISDDIFSAVIRFSNITWDHALAVVGASAPNSTLTLVEE